MKSTGMKSQALSFTFVPFAAGALSFRNGSTELYDALDHLIRRLVTRNFWPVVKVITVSGVASMYSIKSELSVSGSRLMRVSLIMSALLVHIGCLHAN